MSINKERQVRVQEAIKKGQWKMHTPLEMAPAAFTLMDGAINDHKQEAGESEAGTGKNDTEGGLLPHPTRNGSHAGEGARGEKSKLRTTQQPRGQP
jgi:hypothetical protein